MRMPKRGEKGFTLIELLIVVAILGVLAAVVIPNVGRFIGRGETEAAETELSNMQSAVIAMMTDIGVAQFSSANLVDTTGTNNMAAFPAPPYVLYQNTYLGFTVNYVAANQTKGSYTCDIYGTVNQTDTGY
ncbi:type II secretion system protein [Chloroflexota bacterium]